MMLLLLIRYKKKNKRAQAGIRGLTEQGIFSLSY